MAPPVQQPAIMKKSVVVCKKRLAARTRLEPEIIKDAFEMRELIASSVPDAAFTAIASLTNRYTAVTLLPDDVMTPIRLMTEDQVPNLARAIPPGKRAVSIAVSKVTSVGGFIQQGDYVDVIATFRPKNSDTVTKIVLQDIQVLAVGNTYEFDGSIATATPAISAAKMELVTLAVNPTELERLMYLDSGTSFRLVLKNPKDKGNKTHTKGATERMVLSDIGHPNFIKTSTSSADDEASSTKEAVIIEPIDDGRVEIMYGATNRREIYKYGGPAANKFRQLRESELSSYVPPMISSNGATGSSMSAEEEE